VGQVRQLIVKNYTIYLFCSLFFTRSINLFNYVRDYSNNSFNLKLLVIIYRVSESYTTLTLLESLNRPTKNN